MVSPMVPLALPATLADAAAARGWQRIIVDRGGASLLSDLYGVPLQPTTIRPPAGWSGGRTLGGQEFGLERNPEVVPDRWRGSPWEPGVVETMHRADAVARAVAMAWELHIRQVPMDVQPGGTDAQDLAVARFVRACLWDYMAGGWAGWMEQAASYPWRTPGLWTVGWRMDAAAGQAHGIAGPALVIDRVQQLLPQTVARWIPDGARWAVSQWPDIGDADLRAGGGWGRGAKTGPPIPAAELLHLTWDPVGPSPEGVSIYRPAWWPYQLRQIIGPLVGVAAERGAHALPVARPGPTANRADLSSVMEALQNFRAGAYAALAIPAEGWELEFPRIETTLDQLLAAYSMAAREMAVAGMVPWLLTGQDNGTEALIRGQFDPYTLAITSAAEKIARMWSDGADAWIRRLVDANYTGVSRYPFLRVSPLVMASARDLVAMATGAVTAGALAPAADVDRWVRDQIGIRSEASTAEWERAQRGSAEVTTPAEPAAATDEAAQRRQDVVAPAPAPVSEHMSERTPTRAIALPAWWSPGCPLCGPGGRPIRPEEGAVRLSEVVDPLDSGRRRVGEIIAEWTRRAGAAYVRQVAAAPDLQAARRVWVAGVADLTDQLSAEYLSAWRHGTASQLGELRRALRSPKLRTALRSGNARQGKDVPVPRRLAECGHDHGPRVLLAEGQQVKDVDPTRAARGIAGTTAEDAAARVQAAVLQRAQNASVGGALAGVPDLEDLLDEVVHGMSAGWGRGAGGRDINALFGLGRAQQLNANAGAVTGGVYSTLVESDVCPACAEHDGDEVPPEMWDEYSTPASWCYGGDSCRCLLLAVPAADAAESDLVDVASRE